MMNHLPRSQSHSWRYFSISSFHTKVCQHSCQHPAIATCLLLSQRRKIVRLQSTSASTHHQTGHQIEKNFKLKTDEILRIREASATDVPRGRRKSFLTTLDKNQPQKWLRESIQHTTPNQMESANTNLIQSTKRFLFEKGIKHFLPAQYPTSVADGYASYALYGFGASIAGSAAMVLSTQTLLLAVGVVGSGPGEASVLAGALNWVLKDGAGQLGGVLYASFLGRTRRFDANPKRWRMVAALCLDLGTLLEILSPYAAKSSGLVLPLACLANVLKNIGFLTASASRASLHQAMSIQGNLGDVTAKAGSQATAAGLCGTALGIGLSSTLFPLGGIETFAIAFCGLSLLHQAGNYLAVKAVPLTHFNQQRLCLLLEDYCRQLGINNIEPFTSAIDSPSALTPQDVASKESFLPWVQDSQVGNPLRWLAIGAPLDHVVHDGAELEDLIGVLSGQAYIINMHDDGTVYVTFHSEAGGHDILQGMFHSFILKDTAKSCKSGIECVSETLSSVQHGMPNLLKELESKGWRLGAESFIIEPPGAIRYNFE